MTIHMVLILIACVVIGGWAAFVFWLTKGEEGDYSKMAANSVIVPWSGIAAAFLMMLLVLISLPVCWAIGLQ